jgi:acetyl esterase/lipase
MTSQAQPQAFVSTAHSSSLRSPSWQSHIVHLLVRARMRPHAHAEIDPQWVRANMGRPRSARRLMARATGARLHLLEPDGLWPGGEQLTSPTAGDDTPVLLYLHGGGFIACSPETHRPLVGSLARRLDATAFVPKYRLAPEHRFPAALDDAVRSYRYLLETRGVHPSRLVVIGDSAGGGLALSLLLAVREQGLPMPAAVVTFSPWADLSASGASLDENTDKCAMFAGDTIRRAARFYLGDRDPMDPLLSPVYADLHGFPPMLVHASCDEVLRDDSVRIVQHARDANVPVTFRLWRHVPHVWQFFVAVLPEARESLTDVVTFVRTHTKCERAHSR